MNVPEKLAFQDGDFSFPLWVTWNEKGKGFAANHNAALRAEKSDYFCVMNPDIRLTQNPFPRLLDTFESGKVGVVAPLVVNPEGEIEDSARRGPTPLQIALRMLGLGQGLDYPIGSECIFPDWVAGMFMLFSSETFRAAGGFNERYFLYLEDVDLCFRIRFSGRRVALNPSVSVVHDAGRKSLQDVQHFRWHAASVIRFFLSRVFFASLWYRLVAKRS